MKKSDNKKDISRRDFVNLSAKGVAGAAFMPVIITSCSRIKGANDRISVAHVGVGDRGSGELYGYFLPLKEALNVAACDTYRSRRDNTAEKINAFYKQYESKDGRSTTESNIPEIDKKLNNFPKSKDGWIQSENNTMGKRFIAAIQGKEQPLSPLDEAIISDTISHMGDIAIRTGRKLKWDPSSGQCVGDEEANKLYTREMRPLYIV